MANVPCLPVLFVRGTHYGVGYQIGTTFKERIQQFIKKSTLVQTKLLPFIGCEKGREVFDSYLQSVEEQFPYYVDEIRGIADGAEVHFDKIFALNISDEVYDIHFADILSNKEPVGCSTVFVNKSNFKVIGHNEDCDFEMKGCTYIVQAAICDAKYGDGCESVTSFSYPGCLLGTTFGFNDSGMIITIDDLCPKEVIKGKTPANFLERALLATKTIEEARDLLANTGYGCATGFCANIASLKNPDLMWNIEVAPGRENRSLISLFKIEEQEHHYVHTNLYKHLPIENKTTMRSCQLREVCANEFTPPKTVQDVGDILGDTSVEGVPIYTLASETNIYQTVATAIFDVINKTLEIYVSNPKYGKPLVSLPIRME